MRAVLPGGPRLLVLPDMPKRRMRALGAGLPGNVVLRTNRRHAGIDGDAGSFSDGGRPDAGIGDPFADLLIWVGLTLRGASC